MQIKKNDFVAYLKTPLDELHSVTVKLRRNIEAAVLIVRNEDLDRAFARSPGKCGVPELAAITHGGILRVFPITDKRYRFRVSGTHFIEQ